MENKTNPDHYTLPNGKQAIDQIKAELTRNQFIGFLIGNAIKYEIRAGRKPGENVDEDLAKAQWYREYLKKYTADAKSKMTPKVEFFLEYARNRLNDLTLSIEPEVFEMLRLLSLYFQDPTPAAAEEAMKHLHLNMGSYFKIIDYHAILTLCASFAPPYEGLSKYYFTDGMRDKLSWLKDKTDLDIVADKYGINPISERE